MENIPRLIVVLCVREQSSIPVSKKSLHVRVQQNSRKSMLTIGLSMMILWIPITKVINHIIMYAGVIRRTYNFKEDLNEK